MRCEVRSSQCGCEYKQRKRFRADQAGAEIVVHPAAPERDIAKLLRTDTHVPLDFAGRDSRFEGHRKREAPLQTAKGARGGLKLRAAGRGRPNGPIRPDSASKAI